MTMCDGDDPAVATITGSTCDIRQRTGHQPRLIDLAALHVTAHPLRAITLSCRQIGMG